MRSLIKDAFRISALRVDGDVIRGVNRVGRRLYHSNSVPISNTVDGETLVKADLGLNRKVDLRLRGPHGPTPVPNCPIIIFLRRGIPTATRTEDSIRNLAVGAYATIVEIDYRLSKQDVYPAPIHTVLAGYDWVEEHLVRNSPDHDSLKIGVCGELAGGSLATMLALTECFYTPESQKTLGISALAVGNPVLDWTSLTRTEATRNVSSFRKVGDCPESLENNSLSTNGLCDIRDTYFSKAETYFDPFASPLLFFRTPGCEIPDETAAAAEHSLLNGSLEDENILSSPIKKRRSARRYPPTGSNLLLPWTRMEVGKGCVLKDQGVDLVEMMRKSVERSRVDGPADAKNAVKRDFEVMEREGIGLWDEKHTLEIGQWFGEALRKP